MTPNKVLVVVLSLLELVLVHEHSSLDISKLWGLFYKFELPEAQLKLHLGYFVLVKGVPTTIIRFEKAFLIEIYYSI